jgi:hypothetical protein
MSRGADKKVFFAFLFISVGEYTLLQARPKKKEKFILIHFKIIVFSIPQQ